MKVYDPLEVSDYDDSKGDDSVDNGGHKYWTWSRQYVLLFLNL